MRRWTDKVAPWVWLYVATMTTAAMILVAVDLTNDSARDDRIDKTNACFQRIAAGNSILLEALAEREKNPKLKQRLEVAAVDTAVVVATIDDLAGGVPCPK